MKFQEPHRINKLLKNYKGLWGIAGGWAIDLFLNKETRAHQDIEVFILRQDQLKFKKYLKSWSFQYSCYGQLSEWGDNKYLEPPIHEIQGTDKNGGKIEILLNEELDGVWRYRRNPEINYPMQHLVLKSNCDIPILSPVVVLLYKSKNSKEKDLSDLRITLPALNNDHLFWLKNSIQSSHQNEAWIKEIKAYNFK